jgi:hypothetical protein
VSILTFNLTLNLFLFLFFFPSSSTCERLDDIPPYFSAPNYTKWVPAAQSPAQCKAVEIVVVQSLSWIVMRLMEIFRN